MVGATVAKLVIEEGHWSCSPESVSGHVQIFRFFIFNRKIKIWTRPDFLFLMKKIKSGLDYNIEVKMNSVRPDLYLSVKK